MTIRQYASSGLVSQGPVLTDRAVNFEFIDSNDIVTSSESSLIDIDDGKFDNFTEATYDTNAFLQFSTLADDELVITNLTPSVVSYNTETQKVTRIMDGVAKFQCKGSFHTLEIEKQIERIGGGSVLVLVEWLPNTLAKACTDMIDDKLVGKSASTDLQIYSNVSAGTRNANIWTGSSVDLSCIGRRMTGNGTRNPTLITDRHIIFAKHFRVSIGATIRFVAMDGTIVERTMTHRQDSDGDVTVGLLNADVPASIIPAKFTTMTFLNKFKNLDFGIPTIGLNQFSDLSVQDCWRLGDILISYREPTDEKRLEFYKTKIGGDSGSGAYFLFDNKLVLASCWTSPNGGTSVAQTQTAIQTAVTNLASGYTLDTEDGVLV